MTEAAMFLHDSLLRRRVRFTPIDASHVRLYVCGPTVYDLPHLGNVRSTVVWDVLVRLLRALYPRVTYVRNITDVDDKINARAAASGESIGEVTRRTAAEFAADMASIGNLAPDIEPRATGHIAEMVEMIGRLIGGGHAYAADGHVLFSVASFSRYGELSGRSPDELLAGARVEVATYKRDPGDFVLWKPSAEALPGWESPWGRGRPGWHIECSAMSHRYLGADFDIHAGGDDLLFPHHENERAQSLCAYPGSGFAHTWMHNGMMLVGGEKMSKSLGNFLTLRDVLAQAPAEAVRLAMLKSQYRGTLDFSGRALEEAGREMDRLYRGIEAGGIEAGGIEAAGNAEQDAGVGGAAGVPAGFMEAMCDDLNTPLALAAMHGLAAAGRAGDASAAASLRAAGRMLGLFRVTPERWFHGAGAVGAVAGEAAGFGSGSGAGGGTGAVAGTGGGMATAGGMATIAEIDGRGERIEAAIAARLAARAAKDWATADAIRDRLAGEGIVLEDKAGRTTWRRA